MRIVAIEGVSGAGKSTLIRNLEQTLNQRGLRADKSTGIDTVSQANVVTQVLRNQIRADRFLRLPWIIETGLLSLEMFGRVQEFRDSDVVLYEGYEPALFAYQLARAEEDGVPLDTARKVLEEVQNTFPVPAPLGVVYLEPSWMELGNRLESRRDNLPAYGDREEKLQLSIARQYKELRGYWAPWLTIEADAQPDISDVADSIISWIDQARPMVYVAGPLYTAAERRTIERVAQIIKRLGCACYVPHLDGGLASAIEPETSKYYDSDREAIDKSAIVVAVLNGSDVDSGTAWEIGYATRRGIECIGLVDDTRIGKPATQMNLMVVNSCPVVTIDEMMGRIRQIGWEEKSGNRNAG